MSPSAPFATVPRMSADQMRSWRTKHRYSRRQMATKLGLLERTIEYWEDPDRGPPWYAAALLHYAECQTKESKP